MAGRRSATGGLFGAREPAQGCAIINAKPLDQCPPSNSPHVAESRPAESPWPVVISCSQ
jgi:hypothetical protein